MAWTLDTSYTNGQYKHSDGSYIQSEIFTDSVFRTKRYRECPCSVHDLPPIHAVVISHSHYDHLDYNTVQVINARFGADVRWFVPLGLASWMHDARCENVIEMDWWDENCIPEYPQVKFVFTPTMHWSNRSATDTNKVCIFGY